MKELSIEEKAYDGNYKAYTELINRLENVKNAIKKQNYSIAIDILCRPYPEFQITTSTELKESEDERIVKELLTFFRESIHGGHILTNKEYDSWLAWLEKQGKNNMGISEATKKQLEDNLNEALEKETPESWNEFLEKQDEQRPVIVPKFMVGDFIKLKKDSDETYEVSKIEIFDTDEIYYHLTNGGCVGENADNFELVKHKPADKVEPKFKVGDIISNGTSEVKIIEVNDNSYSVTNDEIENDCNLSNWVVYFKNQDNWKLVEQKPAWSEDDKKMLECALDMIEWYSGKNEDKSRLVSGWLKSLKERVQLR